MRMTTVALATVALPLTTHARSAVGPLSSSGRRRHVSSSSDDPGADGGGAPSASQPSNRTRPGRPPRRPGVSLPPPTSQRQRPESATSPTSCRYDIGESRPHGTELPLPSQASRSAASPVRLRLSLPRQRPESTRRAVDLRPHLHHPRRDLRARLAGHRSRSVAPSCDPSRSPAGDLPAQAVGHRLRRPPSDGEALLLDRSNQLGNAERPTFKEQHGQDLAEGTSREGERWIVQDMTVHAPRMLAPCDSRLVSRESCRSRGAARCGCTSSSPRAADRPPHWQRPGARRLRLRAEGCQSGRMGRPRKPLWPFGSPWVRIPHPPPSVRPVPPEPSGGTG